MSDDLKSRYDPLEALNVPFNQLRIGDWYSTGPARVTGEDILEFARLSGDGHWLHTNEERAQAGPFGRLIAHGTLLLAIISGLEYQLMGAEGDGYIEAFYGLDRVRFVHPVGVDDMIAIDGEVTDLVPRADDKGVVAWRITACNQDGTTVAVLHKLYLQHS